MTGTFVQSIVLTWMICKTNWDKEVRNQNALTPSKQDLAQRVCYSNLLSDIYL